MKIMYIEDPSRALDRLHHPLQPSHPATQPCQAPKDGPQAQGMLPWEELMVEVSSLSTAGVCF